MSRKKSEVQQRPERGIRPAVFGIIVFVVLGLTAYLLLSAFQSKTPSPTAGTIDISASMSGFSQPEITVKVGEPVTIRLTSVDGPQHTDGGGRHQWAVDDFNVSVVAPSLGSNSVTFTPDKVGTFTFYCDICCGGRANPSMNGTLIVEA